MATPLQFAIAVLAGLAPITAESIPIHDAKAAFTLVVTDLRLDHVAVESSDPQSGIVRTEWHVVDESGVGSEVLNGVSWYRQVRLEITIGDGLIRFQPEAQRCVRGRGTCEDSNGLTEADQTYVDGIVTSIRNQVSRKGVGDDFFGGSRVEAGEFKGTVNTSGASVLIHGERRALSVHEPIALELDDGSTVQGILAGVTSSGDLVLTGRDGTLVYPRRRITDTTQ